MGEESGGAEEHEGGRKLMVDGGLRESDELTTGQKKKKAPASR